MSLDHNPSPCSLTEMGSSVVTKHSFGAGQLRAEGSPSLFGSKKLDHLSPPSLVFSNRAPSVAVHEVALAHDTAGYM